MQVRVSWQSTVQPRRDAIINNNLVELPSLTHSMLQHPVLYIPACAGVARAIAIQPGKGAHTRLAMRRDT